MMETHIVTIQFEVPATMPATELHEYLCQVIHEGDRTARDALAMTVSDIKIPE